MAKVNETKAAEAAVKANEVNNPSVSLTADTSPCTGEALEAGKKEERVPYTLPRNVLSSDRHHTVILNGKAYQIKAGVEVEIPKGVAEVLDHALAQREKSDRLQAEMTVQN